MPTNMSSGNVYFRPQNIYFAPVRAAEYCDDRVCLSVREHISGTTCPIFFNFCACYLRLWLGPPLAALRYVCISGLMDDVMFVHTGQEWATQW